VLTLSCSGAHSSSETERAFPRASVAAPSPLVAPIPAPVPVTPRRDAADLLVPASGTTVVAPDNATLASSARGRFPQLEIVSVTTSPPRRSNTYAGHGPRPRGLRTTEPVIREAAPIAVPVAVPVADNSANAAKENETYMRVERRLADVRPSARMDTNLTDHETDGLRRESVPKPAGDDQAAPSWERDTVAG
jgi:hypothetical protein